MRFGKWYFPDEYWYDANHQWWEATAGGYRFGITAYLAHATGRILYLDLPQAGQSFALGDALGTMESSKWVGQLVAPFPCRVVAVNAAFPFDRVGIDPYGRGWLLLVAAKEADVSCLMRGEVYRRWLAETLAQEEVE